MDRPEPKISFPEVILIGFIFICFDLIEILLLLFGLDDFWIMDAISSPMFLYLSMKGVRLKTQLLFWIAELVPWLGALPLLTLGWGLTEWADRHPKSVVAKASQTAATVTGKGSGKILGGADRFKKIAEAVSEAA